MCNEEMFVCICAYLITLTKGLLVSVIVLIVLNSFCKANAYKSICNLMLFFCSLPHKIYFIGLGLHHSLKPAHILAAGLDGVCACFCFCGFGRKLLRRGPQAFTVQCAPGCHVSVLVH